MKKILIIDDVHPILTDGLGELGFDINYQPNATRDDLLNTISEYDGLIVRTKTSIDEIVLRKAANLKFIARAGSGVDNIDTDYCDKNGIVYFNAGEANADAVAEHTLGMLLSLFANIVKADDEVRNFIWDREGNRGVELKGKTVAIIGYGNTGKALAKKLSGFDVKVLAYDKYLKDYSDNFAKESSMNEIFEQADVISFHIPLTKETKYLVDENYLNQFKKNIYLLNLSRGEILNLSHLLFALKNRKVTGCGLDVLENEKLSTMSDHEKQIFNTLKNSSQTILTPHIGGWTSESYEKISKVLLHKIQVFKF